MASKQEIITEIQTGNARVAHTFGTLSDAQLATKIKRVRAAGRRNKFSPTLPRVRPHTTC